jgi:hypothetical protein
MLEVRIQHYWWLVPIPKYIYCHNNHSLVQEHH